MDRRRTREFDLGRRTESVEDGCSCLFERNGLGRGPRAARGDVIPRVAIGVPIHVRLALGNSAMCNPSMPRPDPCVSWQIGLLATLTQLWPKPARSIDVFRAPLARSASRA